MCARPSTSQVQSPEDTNTVASAICGPLARYTLQNPVPAKIPVLPSRTSRVRSGWVSSPDWNALAETTYQPPGVAASGNAATAAPA